MIEYTCNHIDIQLQYLYQLKQEPNTTINVYMAFTHHMSERKNHFLLFFSWSNMYVMPEAIY